jgi:phage virion morphogenesis protein
MIEMELQGLTEAVALFQQLAAKTSDTEPAMRQIAGVMTAAVDENFVQEGRPGWEKLARTTIRARLKKGTWPGKILHQLGPSGGLIGSISQRHDQNTAVVGANKAYAATHQFGDPERNIPARPFLTLQPEDMGEIELRLLRHLLR